MAKRFCKNGHDTEACGRDPSGHCRKCDNIRHAAKRAENPELHRLQSLERQRIYTTRHPDRVRARARAWAAANPQYGKNWRANNLDKKRAAERRRVASNPERRREKTAIRRARKHNASGRYTTNQIVNLLKRQNSKCANCLCSIKQGYHVDHISPLSRGGSNDITNIQLLCPSCNMRKGSKDPIEWARSQGRLL